MTAACSIALALLLAAPAAPSDDPPPVTVFRAEAPHGRVVLDNFCSRFGIPAVPFDHWRHRAMFRCRVCHVDAGFALQAGETKVSAESNESGSHCGACHDGRMLHDDKPVFAACSGWPLPDAARGCTRCHAGADAEPGPSYEAFRAKMPLDEGDQVDWVLAESRGLVRPVDFVKGLSEKRPPMRIDRDVTIVAIGTWLENVTFSHKKHVAWAGCELCHPEVFPLTRRGSVKYDMAAIGAGRYCGACHLSVAFSVEGCRRCHAEHKPSPLHR